MRRILFYILLIGAVVFSTAALLWMCDIKGVNHIKDLVDSIINGTFRFGSDPASIYLYGLILFTLINAALLLTMVLIFLFTFANLNKVIRFYSIVTWFFLSSLIFTGVAAYFYIRTGIATDTSFVTVFRDIHWTTYIPIALSTLMLIIGGIFRGTEKNK